ncbi:sporadically distributed protein, TIGR04141 family [Pseudonocardia thermophila]|uniref:Sporadically distributed protein, TIGR04141 family n=1 Tax=Pseudonocardia thermophila TaxID=1848 RepID=A0A1M6YCM0_PSETH|nr:DUF6119 family protein [Pseudonocardia thermophila]SHL16037.1 sporadically distributed protein, TIGR04141 family [Pseudonocardia thermophila]
MSHLFAQGSVSARLYTGDAAYRRYADEQVERRWPGLGGKSPRIVHAIGVRRRRRVPDEIPFFSRVHLREKVEVIRQTYGLDVALTAIPLTDIAPNLHVSGLPRPDRDTDDQADMRLF